MARTYLLVAGLIVLGACATADRQPAAQLATAVDEEISALDDGIRVDGLIEYARSFPRRHTARGSGTMVIAGDQLLWRNQEDRDRNFSLKTDVIQSVTLRCAAKAGSSVCLEIQIDTVTGLRYFFRDRNWAAGQNTRILEVHEHLKAKQPRILFKQETVDNIG
jgi:hypothetical protein